MKKKSLIAVTASIFVCLLPSQRVSAQTALDQMSVQIESSNSFLPGEGGRPPLTIDGLRAVQSQPQNSNQTVGPPPDVVGNASNGISRTLNANRLIDPVTGAIDRSVESVSGIVNNAINRALSGILSPVDGVIDRTLGNVNGAIDRAIGNVMGPVDNVINNVLAGIDKEINDFLDGIFGSVGGAVDGALGGVLGGIFGNGSGDRSVEKLYNPITPVSSAITAASFQSLLPGVTAPYTEAIPFTTGSRGLPDYSAILPTLDELVAGERGNPNQTLQGADRFSTTPQTLTMSLRNEVERIGSRSIANSTLSMTGQEAMKADLEGATKTLEAAVVIADESQELDVTQDIMKNLSAQLAQDSVLRANQLKESTLAREQAAADSVITTQISEALDEQNRARRVQYLGNSARMHLATGQLHLPGEMSND